MGCHEMPLLLITANREIRFPVPDIIEVFKIWTMSG